MDLCDTLGRISLLRGKGALGRPTVLHGVDLMPPKNGITDEQMLKYMGANVTFLLKMGQDYYRVLG